ncbi:MAG TPA: hypothetical protein VE442_09360 [Jatrophihabitans sp.]|nr:hypothetical protein [Jatrophihabitans sp.]
MAAELAAVYDDVRRFGRRAPAAELGYRLRAAGQDVPLYEFDHPYTLLAKGQWQAAAAAAAWAGCPYEEALARTQSTDPAQLLAALDKLESLRAEPLARLVLSVRTVDTHVGAILTKLDAKTRRCGPRQGAGLARCDAPRTLGKRRDQFVRGGERIGVAGHDAGGRRIQRR